MKNLKTRIAAATALSLVMAEAAPLAYAAQSLSDSTAIDRIVTGPVPQGVIRLAQQGDTSGSGLGSGETDVQRLRRERQEQRRAQQQEQQEQKAEPAAEAEEPAPRPRAEQPAAEDQAPAKRRAQPAEEAAPAKRRAEQPAEEQAEPPARRAQPAEEAPPARAEQPAEEAPARRAQPAEPAEQPAVTEGQGQASREDRLRQRREALRKLQQEESGGAAGGAEEAPAAQPPAQSAEPATPAEPAAPAEPQAPRQAQPAEPAQPADPAQPATPRQAQPAQPDAAEQAQPNETAREKRLRERREALRKLQQGDGTSGAAGENGEAVDGGPVRQPGATEPPQQAGQPDAAQPDVVEGAPENAAPILDSQKPRRRPGDRGNEGRGNGGREIGEGNGTVAPPIARSPTPPPESDADAQADRPRAADIPSVREEEGRRVEDRPRRYERREGADVLEEIGSRVILELGNQLLIENNDRSRITRNAKEVYYEELPRGRTRETIVRPNGVTIVTVRDRYGEVIRRSRIAPDGRESVLVYVDEERLERRGRGEWRDPGDDLPPLVIDMPYEEYIFDAERVEPNDDEAYYEFLEQPPVEKVERLYSIDEVKRSARVRDSVRRIDLDTVTFDTGSATIAEGQVEKLDGVANAMLRILESNPAETFLIEGHTDAVGSDLSNLALSDERAEAVASALTQVFEIPAENLTTQGYGEQYLKIDTEGAERENRRVAIRRITPLVAPVASAE